MFGLMHIRRLSTTSIVDQLWLLSRLRVVDNSSLGKQAMLEGKPPKLIGKYTRRKAALLGDRIIVAIKGQKKRGYIVGIVQRQEAMRPRFDSNNLVLVDDNGNPAGTRILAPIPHLLRSKPEFAKIVALATKFV